jgi:serine/threonine protein phosphatase PrpC
MAARTVTQQYYADPSEDPSTRLRNAVQAANAEVHRQAQSNTAHIGMGTTMVVTALVGRKAYIASVGDSRAYVIHNGKLDQITQDHSFVGEQVRAGILTKEQARSHPQRNVITRALGSQPIVTVDASGELARRFPVLCTDGLTGRADDGIRDTVLQCRDRPVQKLSRWPRMTVELTISP